MQIVKTAKPCAGLIEPLDLGGGGKTASFPLPNLHFHEEVLKMYTVINLRASSLVSLVRPSLMKFPGPFLYLLCPSWRSRSRAAESFVQMKCMAEATVALG